MARDNREVSSVRSDRQIAARQAHASRPRKLRPEQSGGSIAKDAIDSSTITIGAGRFERYGEDRAWELFVVEACESS